MLRSPLLTPWRGALLLFALVGACDGDGDVPPIDASIPGCASDEDCADSVFCNGVERCDPENEAANLSGCIAGEEPCVGMRCEEAAAQCSACDEPDADGDGHDAIGCGGDDCDDEDASRFPGALEVCDLDDRDEDCDSTTFGNDADGDGYVPSTCCNRQFDGTLLCGRDCADDEPAVNPDATEVCNGNDEDCDGLLDEGVPHVIYPDEDGDGFGVSEAGQSACTLPEAGYSFRGGDCDDTAGATNPGAPEECDQIDNDCDGAVDQLCSCDTTGATRPCGPRAGDGSLQTRGACRAGEQACLDGVWSECVGDQAPEDEFCDGVDDDCDGFIDEGVVRRFFLDADGDGYGDARRPVEACRLPLSHVRNRRDCDDDDDDVRPDATETCDDDIDNDCDGTVDEDCGAGS